MRCRLSSSLSLACCLAVVATGAARGSGCAPVPEIRQYIRQTWATLTRSNANLLKSAIDTKVGQDRTVTLYVPNSETPGAIVARLRREMPPSESRHVRVARLPGNPGEVKDHGLLYLPYPYVVPGGRFNEMYGWDSYFILLGLLADGQIQLAKDMTGNFIYEVEHYGKVLNANRSYYLTRSQPPFLSRMVLEVYRRTGDVRWLEKAVPPLEKYYEYWTTGPHYTPATGLSRYYGGADTPAPEVVEGERDKSGRSHYDRVREYYGTHKVEEYDAARYYDRSKDQLTPLFYLADRAMRESGFDPSARFGPFSAAILDYDPVDLNSLLYRMEIDLAAIDTLLDRTREAHVWAARAQERAAKINSLMWNEGEGLYFDYDFERKRQSGYRFATTFYPLWAGIASNEQASNVAAALPHFERAWGLQTSDRVTGNQWDAPFGWAPMQMIAVQGLRRYGFAEAAERIAIKFLAMVLRDFAEHGTIKEKYDVVAGKSDLAAGLRFGYTSNEAGFGWTNAAFEVLYEGLSDRGRERLQELCRTASPDNAAVTLRNTRSLPADMVKGRLLSTDTATVTASGCSVPCSAGSYPAGPGSQTRSPLRNKTWTYFRGCRSRRTSWSLRTRTRLSTSDRGPGRRSRRRGGGIRCRRTPAIRRGPWRDTLPINRRTI